MSDHSIQRQLQPLLTALSTHQAVSEVLDLRQKISKEICENKASFESILQNYRALTASFVKRALALVLSKSDDPSNVAGLGLEVAADIGNLDLVQVFYDSASVSNNHKCFSLFNAALKGHLEIVKYLLKKTTLSKDQLKNLYANVTIRGQTDVLKFLLRTIPPIRWRYPEVIEEDFRGDLTVSACFHGHFDIVKLLVASGPVSSKKIAACLIVSTLKGHHEITRYLMFNKIAENSGCVIC